MPDILSAVNRLSAGASAETGSLGEEEFVLAKSVNLSQALGIMEWYIRHTTVVSAIKAQ